MKRIDLLLTLILAFSLCAEAQPARDEFVMGFRILRAEKIKSDLWRITMDKGEEAIMAPNTEGEVWGRFRNDVTDHNIKLGTAVVKSSAGREMTAELQSDKKIFPGDILFVNASIPRLVNRSPYFNLVTYGIDITDQQNISFYTPDEVFRRDGFPFRTEKFLIMKAEINRVGQQLQQKGDTTLVEAGPHAGSKVWEVMEQTDTLAVWLYVYHVFKSNDLTMGQTIVLGDGYFAYAREGDAASETILKDYFPDESRDQWELKFKQYKRKLPVAWAIARKKEAIAFRDKGEWAEAYKMHDLSIFIAGKYSDPAASADCLFEKGETLYGEKKYEEAKVLYVQARTLYEKARNDLGIIRCDVTTAYALKNLGLTEEALRTFQSAKKMVDENAGPKPGIDYDRELYRIRTGLASINITLLQFEKAKNFYHANDSLARNYSWNGGQAQSNWGIAYTLETEKKYSESVTYYEKSGKFYLDDADTSNALDAVEAKARALDNAKDYQKALEEYRYGITLASSARFPMMRAKLLRAEVGVMRKLHVKDNAINLLEEAMQLYGAKGEKVSQSYTLKEISEVYQDEKNFALASAALTKRLVYLTDAGSTLVADVYWDLAYMQSEVQKNYRDAVINYKKAVSIYAQSTDTTSWKSVLCNLAIMYKNLEDSVNSYRTLQSAIGLTLKNSDPSNLAFVYDKAIDCYDHFGHYGKKMELLKKKMAIYEANHDHVKLAETCKTIGAMLEEKLKDYRAATPYYLRAVDELNLTNELVLRADSYWSYAYNIGQNLKDDRKAIQMYEIAYTLYIQAKDTSNASVVRSNVGQSYWSINNFEKAIEAHKAAIYLAGRSGQQRQIFKSWNSLADLYKNTLNPVASADALKNAALAVEKLSDSTLLSATYNDLAGSYSKSKDYASAIQFYEKALVIRKIMKDSANIAATLSSIGAMYQNKSDFLKATDFYNQALEIRNRIHDKAGRIYDLASLGTITQFIEANYTRAEAYFREAIAICKEVKDEFALAFCYDRLNYMYRAEGKSAKAVEYNQMAEGLYRKNNNLKELAELTIYKGFDAFYYYGDQRRALDILDQAQHLQDTLHDKTIQAEIYDVRASVLREMGEFDKALGYTDQGLKLYQELDNSWGISGAYVVKGNIYKQRGEYTTALRYQFKADSMFEKSNNQYTRYVTFTNIGENYAAQGDYDKALEFYQKANAIFKKAGDQNDNVATIQGLIGQSYFYQNNLAEADKWLKESLITCDKAGSYRSKMENLSHLGRLKIAEKKYDEAFRYLSEGIRLSKEKENKLNYLNNLVLMGKLEVERKNYLKARGPLEESVATSTSIGKNSTLWESLYLLGLLYKNTGDLLKSRDYLKEAVLVIEKLRNNVSGGAEAQKLFSSDKNILNVYDALIEVLLSLGNTEEAMTYLQKNNEDILKSKFKALDIRFENKNKNRAIAEERNKKAQLDGIEAQIAAEKLLATEKQNAEKLKNLQGIKTIAENEYLKFINQQINVQPELSKYFNNTVQPTQFRKVKKQIPKDMALVSYLAGENQLYIFAATSDTVVAKIVTVKSADLNRDINAMLNIIRSSMGTFGSIDLKTELPERQEMVMDMKQSDPSIRPFEDAYHYLIAPVSSEIAGKARLCIIPTGSLNYIPFQLLGKTLKNGKFSLLMNQFAIFYANSTDMLFREQSDLNKNYHILAFGNPDRSLPETEKEVNDIKRMYPNASVYVRDEATEDKAKFASESFNVMHFATHGNLDYEDFSKSYLTMAGNTSKSEDGKLTLEELWGMDVMNHLNIVVLSACQTAVTKGSNESSPVSPASGFLQNGVKSVVASLWKVDDEATELLMAEFYSNIRTMDAIDALRNSQIRISTNPKFQHPYYWAGFVLLGDWR